MESSDAFNRLRYKYWPDRAIGELLSKNWMETAVPLLVLVLVIAVFASIVENFLSYTTISGFLQEGSELGFIVLGMAIVLIVGGIDLSVGSIYAICNVLVLYLIHVQEWPAAASIGATLLMGAALGAVNGVLIGYLKLRAFLTTLVTLIVLRAIYNLIQFKWAVASHRRCLSRSFGITWAAARYSASRLPPGSLLSSPSVSTYS